MQLSKEEVVKRISEIPVMIEQLKAEHNQLIGYQTALTQMEEAEKPKEKKKDDSKATN